MIVKRQAEIVLLQILQLQILQQEIKHQQLFILHYMMLIAIDVYFYL